MKALVIGTCHEYQRRQDNSPESDEVRTKFDEHIRKAIADCRIDLVAEEAGDDEEVWAALKAEDDKMPAEFRPLFAGTELVEGPQATIARMVARDLGCKHVDIRDRHAAEMTNAERDGAMVQKTVEASSSEKSVMIIVGEVHRTGVARILHDDFGWEIESYNFPRTVN